MDAVYYGEILDNQNIVRIGLLLSKFNKGEITYTEFQEEMKREGIDLSVKLIDSKRIKLLKNYNEFEKRVETNTIIAKDVDRYFGVDKKGIKFQFSYDRTMINALAEYGDEYAIAVLEHLRKIEQRLGGSRRNASRMKK